MRVKFHAVQNVHDACLRERDEELCHLFIDELQPFVNAMVAVCGRPPNCRTHLIFRVENTIYIRAPKAYRDRCKAFYGGWISAKPNSLCSQVIADASFK